MLDGRATERRASDPAWQRPISDPLGPERKQRTLPVRCVQCHQPHRQTNPQSRDHQWKPCLHKLQKKYNYFYHNFILKSKVKTKRKELLWMFFFSFPFSFSFFFNISPKQMMLSTTQGRLPHLTLRFHRVSHEAVIPMYTSIIINKFSAERETCFVHPCWIVGLFLALNVLMKEYITWAAGMCTIQNIKK